jgi:hypothetical protein
LSWIDRGSSTAFDVDGMIELRRAILAPPILRRREAAVGPRAPGDGGTRGDGGAVGTRDIAGGSFCAEGGAFSRPPPTRGSIDFRPTGGRFGLTALPGMPASLSTDIRRFF